MKIIGPAFCCCVIALILMMDLAVWYTVLLMWFNAILPIFMKAFFTLIALTFTLLLAIPVLILYEQMKQEEP